MPDTEFPPIILPIIAIGVLWAYLGGGDFIALMIGLAVLVGVWKCLKWAFWPRHTLPRHRVRHQRIRLYLRLHPGRGHATVFELWRHWSARASAEKDRYARP